MFNPTSSVNASARVTSQVELRRTARCQQMWSPTSGIRCVDGGIRKLDRHNDGYALPSRHDVITIVPGCDDFISVEVVQGRLQAGEVYGQIG